MSDHPSSGGTKLPDLKENAGEVVQSRSGDELLIDNLFDSERRQRIIATNLDHHTPFRQDSINRILERCEHYRLSPVTAHRAVTYFDRFLSRYSVPAKDNRRYRILATACLTAAAEVEGVQVDLKIVDELFTDPTVEEMASVIKERFEMDPRWVTPFDFHNYFISRIPLRRFRPANHVAVDFTDLVMRTISAGDYVRFLPSEVAAAAVILVTGGNVAIPDAFYERVNKVRVISCRQQLEGHLPGPCASADCVAPPPPPPGPVAPPPPPQTPPGPVAVHDSTVSTSGNRTGTWEGRLRKPCADRVAPPPQTPPGPVAVHDSTVSTSGNRTGTWEGRLRKPCADRVAPPLQTPPGPVAVHDSTVSTSGNRTGSREGRLRKRRRI